MDIDLVVGSDHRGYKLKTIIEKQLIPIDTVSYTHLRAHET